VRYRARTHVLGRSDVLPLDEARDRSRFKLLDLMGGPRPARDESKRRTVADLWTEWEGVLKAKRLAGDLAERTLEEYRRLWTLHLIPALGSQKLEAVTPGLVHDFKI